MSENRIYQDQLIQILSTVIIIASMGFVLWKTPWFSVSPVLGPLLLSFMVPFFYLFFFKPHLAALGFYFLVVFRFHEIFPFLSPYKLPFLFAITGLISLLTNIGLKKIKVYWTSEMYCFFAFFVLVTLGVPLSYSVETSWELWKEVFIKLIIIFFMFSWAIREGNHYKWVIILTVFSGVFLSYKVIYNKIHALNLVEGTRATLVKSLTEKVMINDPNDLALTLLFPLSFCCSLFFEKSNRIYIRFIGLISSFLVTLAIVYTQSRGGLLGLGGVFGYFISRGIKSIPGKLVIGFSLATVLLMAGHVFQDQRATTGSGLDMSAQGRIYAWKAALNMAMHHPVFGVGPGGFGNNYYQYATTWDFQNRAVHSSWLGALAETGFPGFFLFIACVCLVIRSASKNVNTIGKMDLSRFPDKTILLVLASSIYAGMIGFCISSTFLTQTFTWPLYVFSALSFSLGYYTNKRVSANGAYR